MGNLEGKWEAKYHWHNDPVNLSQDDFTFRLELLARVLPHLEVQVCSDIAHLLLSGHVGFGDAGVARRRDIGLLFCHRCGWTVVDGQSNILAIQAKVEGHTAQVVPRASCTSYTSDATLPPLARASTALQVLLSSYHFELFLSAWCQVLLIIASDVRSVMHVACGGGDSSVLLHREINRDGLPRKVALMCECVNRNGTAITRVLM